MAKADILSKNSGIARALAAARPECPTCGGALDRHRLINPGHCGQPQCALRHVALTEEKRAAEQKARNIALRATARRLAAPALARAAKATGAEPKTLIVATVPFEERPVEPLPADRRAAFEAHLDAILAEAAEITKTEVPIEEHTDPSPEPGAYSAGCAACQGHCCRAGGGKEHAFLTSKMLAAAICADPDLSAEALRQTYLDALPAASVQASCVFLSERGCTLPRTRRSSTCNLFHCGSIIELSRLSKRRPKSPVALVAIADDQPRKVIAFNEKRGGMVLSETLQTSD